MTSGNIFLNKWVADTLAAGVAPNDIHNWAAHCANHLHWRQDQFQTTLDQLIDQQSVHRPGALGPSSQLDSKRKRSACSTGSWLDADARIQARGPCIPLTQPHLLRTDKGALRRGSAGAARKKRLRRRRSRGGDG